MPPLVIQLCIESSLVNDVEDSTLKEMLGDQALNVAKMAVKEKEEQDALADG